MAFSASIKSAQQKPNKFDLSGTTVTTCDFFTCKPVFCAELVPGQSFNVDCRAFARLEPIQKPLYGSAKLYHRFFFVPNRTLMTAWDDFITQKSTRFNGNAVMSQVPYVSNLTLIRIFFDSTAETGWWTHPMTSLITSVSSPTSTTQYDFCFEVFDVQSGTTGYVGYYKFTTRGKRFYDILINLGYNINFTSADSSTHSLLPLLSFCRIFYDFYRNSAFENDNRIAPLEMWFSRACPVGLASAYITPDHVQLRSLLDCVWRVFYEQDYFTVNQVRNFAGNDYSFAESDNPSHEGSGKVSVTGVGTPYLETSSGSGFPNPIITQHGLDLLKGLADYVKRYALAGWKAADRYLARFGITLSDSKLNQSIYLGRQVLDLQISDVMSNADTTGASLGDYSGKGVFVGDSGKISYSADEFGFLICVQSCVPMTGYVQGRPRYLHHLKRFDFYSPEFDRAGTQATRFDELYADAKTKAQVDHLNLLYDDGYAFPDSVFGYLPRYAEYKVGRDILSGDFCLNTRNSQLDGYHFFRLFSFDSAAQDSLISISAEFCRGEQEQFDRIFTDTTGHSDGITCVIRFIVDSYSPMSQLFENYDFDGFKQVQLDLQGRHVQ